MSFSPQEPDQSAQDQLDREDHKLEQWSALLAKALPQDRSDVDVAGWGIPRVGMNILNRDDAALIVRTLDTIDPTLVAPFVTELHAFAVQRKSQLGLALKEPATRSWYQLLIDTLQCVTTQRWLERVEEGELMSQIPRFRKGYDEPLTPEERQMPLEERISLQDNLIANLTMDAPGTPADLREQAEAVIALRDLRSGDDRQQDLAYLRAKLAVERAFLQGELAAITERRRAAIRAANANKPEGE